MQITCLSKICCLYLNIINKLNFIIMKKFLFSVLAGSIATFGLAQSSTIFEDSFEAYEDFAIENVGEWTLIDVDQLPTYGIGGTSFPNATTTKKAFQVWNPSATTPPLEPTATMDWSVRTGDKAMVAFASQPAGGNYNDDWLISPKVTLGTANNVLSFWYKAAHKTWGNEEFKVGISTTGNTVADFTIVSDLVSTNGDITFKEFTYNFPDEYNGKDIYIAINCISKDQFGFIVDDFKVVGEGMSVSDIASEKATSIYPNPVKDMLNINLAESFNKSNTVINVYSAVGKKAATFKYNSTLNVSNLAKGAYVLEITDGAKTISKKFIKK